MMRSVKIKLIALLILIFLSSCAIRRLDKQKFESSASVESEIRKQDDHHARYDGKRIILMTDSADELYTISIIPADTFSFSTQHGFRGKAEKIEISGLRRRLKTLSDSTLVHAEQQIGRTYEEHKQSERNELARTRVLETKRWPVILLLIVLVGFILIGWWLRRRVM